MQVLLHTVLCSRLRRKQRLHLLKELKMASNEASMSSPAEEVPKIETSEGVKEASEAPKASEVKTKVKMEETNGVSEVATVDEDQRKLFVGGLAQESKDTDVKEYFGRYGEIEHINLKHDPMTGRSRGFAFIVFKEISGLVAASAQEAHVIKGKRATCKKAEVRQGKIYVGKLPAEDLSNQDLTDHFNQFGSVVEVIRPVDKLKEDAPKNFCFVTFDKEEPAKQLVMKGFTSIKGHQVVVSRVTPKDGGRGGFMGRGRGRGGYGVGFSGAFGGGYPGYGGGAYYGFAGAYPAHGFGDPYAGAYGYGGAYGADFGSGQGGYFTSGYSGRPSPGKMMRGRGGRGRPY